jgi:3-phosphoshikimate 1-carboxyvinyltransferase
MADLEITAHGGSFRAECTVPGDKSLSHRALLFAAIAEGDSLVQGRGPGADVASTVDAIVALGVDVDGEKVRSPGIAAWTRPPDPIDCGNSGTTMRLLAGALATTPVTAVLAGDASLSRRPMERLVAPLRALGGRITTTGGTAPLTVGGANAPVGAEVAIDIASAQVRTAFELAALSADGSSTIDSPPGFRDHTERWLHAIGLGEWESRSKFRIHPGPVPAARYEIPGDPSSAAYLWACTAISPGSTVTTRSISLNPGRLGFLEILGSMGAGVEAEVTGSMGGDPVGDVSVTGAALSGVDVGGDLVASALDELPLVAVLGAHAEGITRVQDASELRAKESDRINSTVDLIRSLGGGAEPKSDGFDVLGTGFLEGGFVETHGDHRIAMAAAVAATQARDTVTIADAEVASVSWPGFYRALEGLWS